MSDHDGLGPEGSYFENKARREEEARKAKGDAMFRCGSRCCTWCWASCSGCGIRLAFVSDHPDLLYALRFPVGALHQSRGGHADLSGAGLFFGLWHPGWLVFLAIPLGEMYKS